MKTGHFLLTLLLLMFSFNLTAQEKQSLRTYLPTYRMKQFFNQDFSGRTPWYSMRPLTKRTRSPKANSFPADYSFSTGEMILNKFDQIYYFSAVMNENGETLITQENLDQLKFLERERTLFGTEIILCISGNSSDFIPQLRDEGRRSKILEEISSVLEGSALDGLDLDWEFPRNDQEKAVYIDFLNDLKTICSKGKWQLSIAASRFRALPVEAYEKVDFVNLMTYDFYGRHSTFESTKEALDYMMARYSIPAEKLLMGIPYYGRIFDGYSPDYWKKSQSYRELKKLGESSSETNEIDGYFFNGIDAVKKKIELGQSMNLGGYFIWEIGQDSFDKDSLTKQIYQSLHR